jgi:hypothetical protein
MKVHENVTWSLSASLGAHIHNAKQRINLEMSMYLLTQMTAEVLIGG